MSSSIKLENIDLKAGTQTRVRIHPEIVDEYAECMKNGDKFPPIIVFKKGRADYILADGFHRYRAAEQNKQKKIACEIIEGGERDALEYALQANATHGLRRTNKDKRKSVMMALKDEEWHKFSNRELARLCAVSEFLVRNARKEFKSQSSKRSYTTKHGTIAEMNTEKIGKGKIKASPQQKVSNQLKTLFPKTLNQKLERYALKQNKEEFDVIKQALNFFLTQKKK